ncbi:MAG TPA: two-component regulator propeller domain-containing protein [Chitinophagaceae bacterium]|jgi:signal transduction histidine kinase/ligand-binding sensor domain-containing protein/DNA-binding response OmpR family regulator|nr:two-component regulator propeller domain-containing protein [Chitinophagaceae bacterium]
MRFLSWTICLCLSLSVFAQSHHYIFSKLDIYNGLSHNQVTAIIKDSDGFLWFGTMSGLNRYDGYSCKIFRSKPGDSTSVKDNAINSLYQLPGGKIWVGTGAGPCIYNSHTEKFDADYPAYLQSLGLPSGNIANIVKGNNERYWFLYDDLGLYLYSDKEKKAKAFGKNFIPNFPQKISSIAETKDDQLWLVYQNGFLQQYDLTLNKVTFSSASLQHLNKGNNYYNLLIDRDGDVWLWCFSFGVFLFHPPDNSIRQLNESSYPSKLNTNLISQLIEDDNGLIWVATDHGGINLVDKKNNCRTIYLLNDLKDTKSLSHNSITTIYKDDNGIIWLGTYKQGINYFNNNIVKFPRYYHQPSNTRSLQYDDVNRFVEDKLGNIWIGTNGGGLIYFDRKNNTFKQYLHDPNNKNILSNNVIVSMWIDHEGILWIGTFLGGLNSFDGKKFTHYRHSDNDSSSLANDNVWEIFEDRERNLWIGTLGGGLDLFDRKTQQFEHYQLKYDQPSLMPSNYISSILQDKKGNLWIGTNNGIAVFEKNRITPKVYQNTSDKKSLSSNIIMSLLEDSRGRIWVGTREGLNLFNEQTKDFQIFTASDGLPDNSILDILEGDHQTIWLSTSNGLCNAIPKQNENGVSFSIINYDETNNLQNREFNDNAALKTRAGELIFGGPSGFNIINPGKIMKPVYHPKIVFTSLQILNNNVEPGELINNRVLLPQSLPQLQSIDLKYKENVFSIEFASLDFSHSARDKYAYMLDGFNSDWLYADGNQRRVTYTNLDPGHYTFKVKVLNGGNVWSEEKKLGIYIAPPMWRTPVAYVIYTLLIAGLLYLIRRITLERIRMRFETKQQRREAERAHALDQMKTKFFTNVSHEFRTPLSLIISPLDKIIKHTNDDEQKKQLSLIHRNAKRLLNLVNQLLDFRKMEVQEVKLHPAIGDIVQFAKDISYSFSDVAEKKGIQSSFESNVESLEIYFDKDKIEKILFNLLSNAYKYTHDNGKVSVRLQYTPPAGNETAGTLAIEVSDTGIGIPADMHEKIFERFFQTHVPDSMVNQGTGIGLAITKEFVKLHNGVITVKSEPEKGTCFTVLLPANKINAPISRWPIIDMPVEEVEKLTLDEIQSNGKSKTILVVEDNEDIRFYLKDNLKAHYHVEQATNGNEGWDKVKQLNPDIVVSDIMMPVMDGIELARHIKTDTATAHIPVILLTAMGSEEKQLEGYKIGIHDYITKPFTFEILASRIKNLLAQQKLLQKRFQKQIEVNPSEITITPLDEKFMKQALEVVEKNMDNPDFSVEDLSREMNMSRVTLYRKIVSLTGKPPLEFIRSIRLKRAAQLLEKSGMTIAEIAYEVGFNSPKVFSKFFKEEFRLTPSQYIASRNEKNA